MNLLRLCWPLDLALGAGASASDRIDWVEFFGYQGLDVDIVRKALPLPSVVAGSREEFQQAIRVK